MTTRIAASRIRLKRAYDPPAPEDGARILVDRLWPRGVRREAAELDQWMKDIAPSPELRKWFGHDPGRWEEFRFRYAAELREEGNAPLLSALRALARQAPLTLVYGAHDSAHNHAIVLRNVLLGRAPAGS